MPVSPNYLPAYQAKKYRPVIVEDMLSHSRYYWLTMYGVFWGCGLLAQNKSNKGREFWLGYGHNVLFTAGPPINSQTHVLYISAEQAANVTVSVNGTGWSQTVSVPANTVDYSVIIPKNGPDDARLLTEGLSTRGIHVVSDVPVVVYSHQQGSVSSGATMLMPVETFGYTYYSLNFTQISNYTNCYSWFYVVAAENNTRLQIIPSDSTEGGWLPMQTYTVNLNKGEIYNVFGKRTGLYTGKDMSGSKIVSVIGADGNCHPVAVFSGSSRNIICPTGNGGEVMQQQIFPAIAWGTRYITYHTVMNANGDISTPFLNYYRVAVRNPNTVVTKNGIPLTGLINNFYYEFTSNTGDNIEADQPVLVAQYAVSSNECTGSADPPMGDPEMMYLSPIEQGVKSAYFYTTRNQAIDLNFINIIIPQAGLSSLIIDGTPPSAAEYITHPTNAGYAVVVRRFFGAAAQHNIKSDSSFIASVYGSGFYESYGYNMGTMVNNLNAYSSIRNKFSTNNQSDTFTCPKTPFRLQVKLAYKATGIHWKLSQAGSGLSPNTDSLIVNPVPSDSSFIGNRKYYTYTLQQDYVFNNTGTYFIPLSYSSPDIDACNQTETTAITVEVRPGPVADFTFTNPACYGDSIYFNNAINSNLFTINGYTWYFDDNATQITPNAVKLFGTAGNQSVRYSIQATNGCFGDTTKTIAIVPKPIASFNISNSPYCTGQPITISSGAAGISNWYWNLGNGVKSDAPPFAHTYSLPGPYTISLVAQNAAGCISDTSFSIINISPSPTVNAGQDTMVRTGSSFPFNASVVPAGNYSFLWSPATNLSSATLLNPVVIVSGSNPASYTLQAVDNISGCSDSDNILITPVAGLYVPNAFTPNNDGLNDKWNIPGLALYPEAVVSIYNRWGEKIFETKNYINNPWNGKIKGVEQSGDTFIYVIQLNDDKKQFFKGTVTIIR